jgi:hypothetical protein
VLRRNAFAAIRVATLLSFTSPGPAAADIYPPVAGRNVEPARKEPKESKDWQRFILQVDGGFGFPLQPSDFQSYWNPAGSLGFELIGALAPALDLVARGESYRMDLDAAAFQDNYGAPPEPGDHVASVSPVLLLLRLHPGREGFRPFMDAGFGIMDISRPPLFYFDGGGTFHTIEGAEIFGWDPCYSAGVGIEWTRYRHTLGAAAAARVVNAPGRTEPAHTIATLRAGIQITLPEWLWGILP